MKKFIWVTALLGLTGCLGSSSGTLDNQSAATPAAPSNPPVVEVAQNTSCSLSWNDGTGQSGGAGDLSSLLGPISGAAQCASDCVTLFETNAYGPSSGTRNCYWGGVSLQGFYTIASYSGQNSVTNTNGSFQSISITLDGSAVGTTYVAADQMLLNLDNTAMSVTINGISMTESASGPTTVYLTASTPDGLANLNAAIMQMEQLASNPGPQTLTLNATGTGQAQSPAVSLSVVAGSNSAPFSITVDMDQPVSLSVAAE